MRLIKYSTGITKYQVTTMLISGIYLDYRINWGGYIESIVILRYLSRLVKKPY